MMQQKHTCFRSSYALPHVLTVRPVNAAVGGLYIS